MQDINSLRARLSREEEELATARTEIDVAHRRIDELRQQADSLEKRIKLLREYIQLTDGGGPDSSLAAAFELEEPTNSAPAKTAQAVRVPEPDPVLPDLVTPAPQIDSLPPLTRTDPLDFDDEFDERILADEVLPRAESFEEALLFLMAHYRKRIRPQQIINAFRKLEYSPDIPATKDSVLAQLEQRPAFFANAGKDGFVLTTQGREEAQRLLSQLAL